MKKLARLILSCLVVVNVFVSTAFAATPLPAAYTTVDQESVLCAKDVKYSIGKEQSYARRGTFFDSADVIISVSTGALVNYVATTIITLIVLAGLAYLVNKKYLSKRI